MTDYITNGGYVKEFNITNPGNPYSDVYWDRNKNPVELETGKGPQFKASLAQSLAPFPQEFVRISPTRNTHFIFPSASITPMTLGVAGSPPIGAAQTSAIGKFFTAGVQVNNINSFGNNNA